MARPAAVGVVVCTVVVRGHGGLRRDRRDPRRAGARRFPRVGPFCLGHRPRSVLLCIPVGPGGGSRTFPVRRSRHRPPVPPRDRGDLRAGTHRARRCVPLCGRPRPGLRQRVPSDQWMVGQGRRRGAHRPAGLRRLVGLDGGGHRRAAGLWPRPPPMGARHPAGGGVPAPRLDVPRELLPSSGPRRPGLRARGRGRRPQRRLDLGRRPRRPGCALPAVRLAGGRATAGDRSRRSEAAVCRRGVGRRRRRSTPAPHCDLVECHRAPRSWARGTPRPGTAARWCGSCISTAGRSCSSPGWHPSSSPRSSHGGCCAGSVGPHWSPRC